MSDLINAIIETRKTTANIFVKSLVDLDGKSEIEIKEKILSEIRNHSELFPTGWYDPPPSGVCVLLAQKPFKRLQFDTLRKSEYWPNNNSLFKKETVGIIYFSPVDRKTKMIGDIGFTIYNGNNEEIKKHIKDCYNTIAKHAEVGVKFSELCAFTEKLFHNKLKIIKWITLYSDPSRTNDINLGHTVPGSFEKNFYFENTFKEIKETIRTNRVFINETGNFIIPETCAFTIEARMIDIKKEYFPGVYFHFIVCFDKGKKTILENFSKIFSTVGMDYMNSK